MSVNNPSDPATTGSGAESEAPASVAVEKARTQTGNANQSVSTTQTVLIVLGTIVMAVVLIGVVITTWGAHKDTLRIVVLVAAFGAFGGLISGLSSSGGIFLPATYEGKVRVKEDSENPERVIQVVVLGVFGNILIGIAAAWVVYFAMDPGGKLILAGDRTSTDVVSLTGSSIGLALVAALGGAKTIEVLVKNSQKGKFANLLGADPTTPLTALTSVAEPGSLKAKPAIGKARMLN
jgi:LysM repeat protein